MDADHDAAPDDIADLKEALATERAKGLEIAAELAVARTKASEDSALIAEQKPQIAKLRHPIYGQRSERSTRLIEQLALALEELEADATDRGGRRAGAMYNLIATAKMNGVVPQAWLADVLARIAAHPAHRLDELLPWKWSTHVRSVAQPQAA